MVFGSPGKLFLNLRGGSKVSRNILLETMEKMLETVFDQKSDVTLLSHKIRSKDKEMKGE